MEENLIVEITSELDIVRCRKAVRDMALELGFGVADQTRLVTVASELARNVVQYAGEGKMFLAKIDDGTTKGIRMEFKDHGPGFVFDEAMSFGYSTNKGLGVGLPGSRRLMDELEVESKKGKGATVTAAKYLKS